MRNGPRPVEVTLARPVASEDEGGQHFGRISGVRGRAFIRPVLPKSGAAETVGQGPRIGHLSCCEIAVVDKLAHCAS